MNIIMSAYTEYNLFTAPQIISVLSLTCHHEPSDLGYGSPVKGTTTAKNRTVS